MTVRRPWYSKEEFACHGNEIYERQIPPQVEAGNHGKIVAIDIDNRKIVSIDYDPKEVIEAVHNRQSSGRIWLRRIGKKMGIGIKIW